MHCNSQNVTSQYVPPPIGNGELCVQLDMQGMQAQHAYHGMTPTIWRAGRRYNTPAGELIPFGHLTQDTGKLKTWSQELDVHQATINTQCEYEDGYSITTNAFVHLDQPLLLIRKTFEGSLTLRYNLWQCDKQNQLPTRMHCEYHPNPQGVKIAYDIDGLDNAKGRISFWTDHANPDIQVQNHQISITVNGPSADFYLSFVDELNRENLEQANTQLQQQVQEQGFDGLFKTHCKSWADYWSESYIKLPDPQLQAVYETSQYHLRISSTAWSIPIGIFDTHWQGRYFPFDDHFSYMGLITSGHFDIAGKIPNFRFDLIEQARTRAHLYFGNKQSGARYCWQQKEDGSESAYPSFYRDHIFHLATISLTSWYQYQYTFDLSYLTEKAYPVIANCADFYLCQSIYHLGDEKYIVGKCTDLERLGPAIENAYMTTCGVIATLEIAAEAATVLQVDTDKANRWQYLADKLRESLPNDGKQYIPHPGCEQKNIAMFAGTFPFPVMDPDDPMQQHAIDDFLDNEDQFGNMYPVGNSVCTWYAGWKAVSFARHGEIDKAVQCITQAANEANCFNEVFEISDPPCHPWFTTAEGVYIHAINESLIQSDDHDIVIHAMGLADCAFKLPAMGGVMVEIKIENRTVAELKITARQDCERDIHLPDGTSKRVTLVRGENILC